MTILEFCENRKVQASTVSMYIRRNPELFEGHTTKNGQQTEIDEEAFAILDQKYPIPADIIPSPDAELVKELDRYKQWVMALQQQIIENNNTLALAEKSQYLLEERSSQLEEAKAVCDDLQSRNGYLLEEVGSLKAQLAAAEEKASRASQEAARASQEAEKLRSRSLWQRIFNT